MGRLKTALGGIYMSLPLSDIAKYAYNIRIDSIETEIKIKKLLRKLGYSDDNLGRIGKGKIVHIIHKGLECGKSFDDRYIFTACHPKNIMYCDGSNSDLFPYCVTYEKLVLLLDGDLTFVTKKERKNL